MRIPSVVVMIYVNQIRQKDAHGYTTEAELETVVPLLPLERKNDRKTDAHCFLLKTLDQPLNRYWSVCLPQCVYWLTLLDDDDDDEVFFLLGMEVADANDMVEMTEFDESFLPMTPRKAQLSVEVADRGVYYKS